MLGAIIGDIVGSPYEFNNIKTTDFELFSSKSTFTDDTVMTIAVAVGLIQGLHNPVKSREAIIDAMHDFGNRYPTSYGGRFAEWLYTRSRKPYGSYGNGSAMRCSAAGWLYNSLEEVEYYAKISAAVTHSHIEGIKGAQSVAAAIYLARTGSTKSQIAHYISEHYNYDLSRTLDAIRPGYRFSEICQKSVPEAITAFLESNDFEDAIRKAISLGGDSDTIGAITGSIAEAFYRDIPKVIVDKALSYLDQDLLHEVEKIQRFINQEQAAS